MRIAINGFGRVGRLTLRQLIGMRKIEVVAVNDLTDNNTLAHLFKYDSAQGVFPATVNATEDHIKIGRRSIQTFNERDPAKLPWKKLKVDLVLECTGIFRTKEQAALHLSAGAKKVVISAPAKGEGVKTIVLGVNQNDLTARDKIISNASCTTNCLAPLVQIIDQNWGIVCGSMTTTHAYTSGQNLLDAPHRDLRRARSAAINIVPTSTGAATAVALVYPPIAGKISAIAMRVPVVTGSVVELNVVLDKPASPEQVNAKFRSASKKHLKGILEFSEAPLVSSDIIGNPSSSIFDSNLTQVSGNMLKVISWYDNEVGYAARLADLAVLIGSLKPAR